MEIPCGMRPSSGSTRILSLCSSSALLLIGQLGGGVLTRRHRLRMYQSRWGKDELADVFTAHVDRLEKGLRCWPLIGGDRSTTPGKVMVKVH